MQWLAGRPYRSTSAERVESMLRNHLTATSVGQRRLVSVRPSEVQAWITERSLFLSPGTLRLLLRALEGHLQQRRPRSPGGHIAVLRVSLPAHEPDKVVPLTVKQVEALADAVPARCRAMVIPQAGLGLRISELLGLRGDDVLWLERMVKIDVQRDRHTMGLGPLRTPGSRRKIPLPQSCTPAAATRSTRRSHTRVRAGRMT